MFLKKKKQNHFFVSATNVARTGKQGNVSTFAITPMPQIDLLSTSFNYAIVATPLKCIDRNRLLSELTACD